VKSDILTFISNIICSLAAIAIAGGFLLAGQYKWLTILITVCVLGYVVIQCLNYAKSQAVEARNCFNQVVILQDKLQTNHNLIERYLLDRIQTGDPIVAHNLNVPAPPKQPGKQIMSFPAVDGVEVKDI